MTDEVSGRKHIKIITYFNLSVPTQDNFELWGGLCMNYSTDRKSKLRRPLGLGDTSIWKSCIIKWNSMIWKLNGHQTGNRIYYYSICYFAFPVNRSWSTKVDTAFPWDGGRGEPWCDVTRAQLESPRIWDSYVNCLEGSACFNWKTGHFLSTWNHFTVKQISLHVFNAEILVECNETVCKWGNYRMATVQWKWRRVQNELLMVLGNDVSSRSVVGRDLSTRRRNVIFWSVPLAVLRISWLLLN